MSGTSRIGSLCLIMSLLSFCFAVEVQEEGMSGVQFFFTLLFSILGLGVLAVVGLMVYGRWKENRRKRFYWSENSRSTGFQSVCFSVNVRHNNAKTAVALLEHTIEGTQGQLHGFEAQSQENKKSRDQQARRLLTDETAVKFFLSLFCVCYEK